MEKLTWINKLQKGVRSSGRAKIYRLLSGRMNLSNYECFGQMSIEDYLEQNEPEYVERMLNPGQVVYEAYKGEVKEHTVLDEKWYIEHLETYGNRTKVDGHYGIVFDNEIDVKVFSERKQAEELAEKYLQSHDVIRSEDMHPIKTVAYSFYNEILGRDSIAFYSELDNGMLYVKEFITYEHLMLEKHKKKAIKQFMEQQEFHYNNPQLIEYSPKFKNMYCIHMEYDWDYAEDGHSYAVG